MSALSGFTDSAPLGSYDRCPRCHQPFDGDACPNCFEHPDPLMVAMTGMSGLLHMRAVEAASAAGLSLTEVEELNGHVFAPAETFCADCGCPMDEAPRRPCGRV